MFEFIRDHFFHALPVLVLGTLGAAIILERLKSLYVTFSLKNPSGFFQQIRTQVQSGQIGQAVALCDQISHTLHSKIIKAGLLRSHLPDEMIQQGIDLATNDAIQVVQKRTAYLATIANVATLLGLFGTIAGLIHSFEAVGHADPQQKSALLAAGIATAMNATMLGLGVAIPAMLAYSVLVNRSNRLIAELDEAGAKVLDILRNRHFEDFETTKHSEPEPIRASADERRAS